MFRLLEFTDVFNILNLEPQAAFSLVSVFEWKVNVDKEIVLPAFTL